VYRFASEGPLNVEEVRQRLRQMSDADLISFGKAAKYMCSAQANSGEPPRDNYVLQLNEARAEWRRRKKK
jgi:hypothetical protein